MLGDMDLFFVQGESMSGKYVELAQAKHHEPAGTVGMKATEVSSLSCHTIFTLHTYSCTSLVHKESSVSVVHQMCGLVV